MAALGRPRRNKDSTILPPLRLQPIEHDLRNRAGAGLGPHHLRQLVEVFIAGDECQLMLHGKTRNPEVVGRNRTSRKPQLQEQTGVDLRRLAIGVENSSAGQAQEPLEQGVILSRSAAAEETSPELGEYDKGQPNFSGTLDHLDSRRISAKSVCQ